MMPAAGHRMKRRDFVVVLAAAALVWPRGGQAQQTAMPLIGFLHGSAPVGQYQSYVAAFLAGLGEEGFERGRNLAVEYRWAEGEYERVPALAAELLARKPALIVAYGPPNLLRAAIDAIPPKMPVVFGTGGDPVAAGIVASLGRPGGNATGIANRTNTLDIKRLELLRDLLPEARVIGMVLNLLSAGFLWQKRNRLFSIVIAGLDCLQIPFGTALGVFTIIVLSRESVRELYSRDRKSNENGTTRTS